MGNSMEERLLAFSKSRGVSLTQMSVLAQIKRSSLQGNPSLTIKLVQIHFRLTY